MEENRHGNVVLREHKNTVEIDRASDLSLYKAIMSNNRDAMSEWRSRFPRNTMHKNAWGGMAHLVSWNDVR